MGDQIWGEKEIFQRTEEKGLFGGQREGKKYDVTEKKGFFNRTNSYW